MRDGGSAMKYRFTISALDKRHRRYLRGLIWRLRHTQSVRCTGRLQLERKVRIDSAKDGRVLLGKSNLFKECVVFDLNSPGAIISVGDRTFINKETYIVSTQHVSIGSDCSISWRVSIMDSDFHRVIGQREIEDSRGAPVRIGKHVWIGANALILKGVSVGDGAIIAAGSVVTDDVPERSLVAGVPARVVRTEVGWR